ncbi:hypothetical protein [Seonamhaeicola maritimus]|uniref:Uncharacterized protein n=1 Tax=Seonamhaeicola maritimus TaxID=2591822 RepID=A0A5C7GNH9_9FLAO|nr:hypothetical protein [Seonamhaeicola maritimus]TXG39647.1 hypothetical protein FUA22_07210 [Seonamhaeicola maritimus]
MKRNILFVIALYTVFIFSCKKEVSSNLETELLVIINKLRKDKNHKYLKTLKPLDKDFYKIFKDRASAKKAIEYSDKKWDFIDNLPANAMKPINEDDDVVVAMTTKSQLEKSIYNGLSSDYASMAEFLNEDIVVCGFYFVNVDGMHLKSRAAFFNIEGRWIFIPNVFEAFY